MNFDTSDTTKRYLEQLIRFLEDYVYPLEKEYLEYAQNHTGEVYPRMEELKSKARDAGLWNLFLPKEYEHFSAGLTNVEYASLAEEMGKIPWASEIFNCSAPDTGNMEVLAKYGSKIQQDKWLMPLLDGSIRSAFLMTEPDVASSDARNIETSIKNEGDQYLINGRKWWATGAAHPNCTIYILMGKSNPNAAKYEQHSMILIPRDCEGVKIVRSIEVFNQHDPPGEHCEISLENVRVPIDNIILGEGKGFAIAQGRLGPGRIHHCMRLIGQAQRALDYMCKRVNHREAFGRKFSEFSSIKQTLAEAFTQIQQARLLTLAAADKVDRLGIREARDLIAAIKVVVPRMACEVADQAIQLHGGKGVSNDLPLVQFYTAARALRLADGPDEVHLDHLGKLLIKSKMGREGIDTQYFN